MCFSATASFVAAGIAGGAGLVAMARTDLPRQLPLAATPVIFGLHQAVEGLLWLTLPVAPEGAQASTLTLLFLTIAEAFWPAFAPLAVWLVEPRRERRRLILICLATGLGVGFYLLGQIVFGQHEAFIRDGHIVYVTGNAHLYPVAIAYFAATSLALLLSTRPAVIALGAIVTVGSIVAYGFYRESFVSVWCFFAAAASMVVLFHFERAHRLRLRSVATSS